MAIKTKELKCPVCGEFGNTIRTYEYLTGQLKKLNYKMCEHVREAIYDMKKEEWTIYLKD